MYNRRSFKRLSRLAALPLIAATLAIGIWFCFFGYDAIDFPLGRQPWVQAASAPPKTVYTATIPSFSHIFVIVLENKDVKRITANSSAPYLNQLAARYARATNYYAIRHPSLPNYLALTGGDTFGVKRDCTDCFINHDNLSTQLEQAGHSWKAYMEAMPAPCFVGDSQALYRQKHNPFIYYDKVRNDPTLCNKIVPLTEFVDDLRTNTAPDFVWITPDMCNDMHDCDIARGDAWLQQWVPQILASPAWRNNGVLFITFDEGEDAGGCCTYAQGGQVFTLVISPLVRPGFTSTTAYTHYSLLRTIEEAWRLPLLGNAGCDCTAPMADFFAQTAMIGVPNRVSPEPEIHFLSVSHLRHGSRAPI